MAITVYFSSSSKRENSTKQLSMGSSHSCTFKNGCSMLNPTLFLELDDEDFPEYTAFRIEDHYYNITDIRTVRNNLFEVSGEVDVLATYKQDILNTTAYVIYDTVPNTEIPDNRLPMVTTKRVQASSTLCPFTPDDGTYILSLTGSNDSTGVYKVSEAQLASLIDDIQDVTDNIFDTVTPPSPPPDTNDIPTAIKNFGSFQLSVFGWIIDNFKLAISQFFGSGDISDNIRECKYIPFNVGTTSGQIPIYLGTFKTKVSFGKLNTETVHRTVSVTIPWQANDYRRRSPYTEIYLYLPYIGMVKLSSENLIGQSSLSVSYTLALRDGSLICTVESGSEVIGQYSGNVGASVPVGSSNINLPKAGMSLISGISNAVSKNLGGVGMAAIQFGDAVTPNFSCIGGLDGVAGVGTKQSIVCYTVYHNTNVPPNSEILTIGSPTMAPKPLASLTGYVQTNSASVEGSMSAPERNKINRLLDSGIFIE